MAEDEVKPTEDPEGDRPEPEGSEETPKQSEELILGKYKTMDDFVNAHKELEKTYTQTSQKNAEIERQLQDLQTQQQLLGATQPQTQFPTVPQQTPENPEDLNSRFWTDPAGALDTMLSRRLEPLTQTFYESQKEKLRDDPEFVRLEPQIDAIAAQYPQLKTQAGIVPQLYKMVKGLYFDEGAYRQKLEQELTERLRQSNDLKVRTTTEGGSAPRLPSEEEPVRLSDDEKRVAIKWNPELSPDQAYAKYAEKKKKAGMM